MKRSAIALVLILAAGVAASAQEFMTDDAPVAGLRRAFIRSGLVFPVTRYPVTLGYLEAVAETLPPGDLRDDAIAALAALRPDRPAGYDVAMSLDSAYEADLRSVDLPFISPVLPTTGFDPFRDYVNQPDLSRLGMRAGTDEGLYMDIVAVVKRDYDASGPKMDNLPVMGLPGNPFAMDNHLFDKGVIAWSDGLWRVAFGRDKLHLGAGAGSTLMHSGALPYLDAMTVTLPLGNVRMDWIISTIVPARALGPDVDTYIADDPDTMGSGDSEFDLGYYGFEENSENPSTIFYNIHRFEWIGERFRTAVGSSVLLVRRNNMFTLGDFFPVSTWHNGDLIPNNLTLTLEGSWAVMPGLVLNLTAGFDDISAEIIGMSDSGVPTVDAYLASLEFAASAGPFAIDGMFEAGYTHYLWGNYDGYETGGVDRGALARAIGRYKTDAGAMLLPLTSPYGPGAEWLRLDLKLTPDGAALSFGLDALLLFKIPGANLVETPFARNDAMEAGPRSVLFEAGVSARWSIGQAAVSARPSLVVLDGEFMGRLELGLSYLLGTR